MPVKKKIPLSKKLESQQKYSTRKTPPIKKYIKESYPLMSIYSPKDKPGRLIFKMYHFIQNINVRGITNQEMKQTCTSLMKSLMYKFDSLSSQSKNVSRSDLKYKSFSKFERGFAGEIYKLLLKSQNNIIDYKEIIRIIKIYDKAINNQYKEQLKKGIVPPIDRTPIGDRGSQHGIT